MKVSLRPADSPPAKPDAIGLYRLREPYRVLRDAGYDVELDAPPIRTVLYNPSNEMGLIDPDGTQIPSMNLRILEANCATNVVVFQRPTRWDIAATIPLLQKSGVACVVDIDDDFSCIHPKNGAYWIYHPSKAPHRNFKHLAEACKRADLVTVSTPALAKRYGSHGRVAVLPNFVPAWYLDLDPDARLGATEQRLLVGWAGVVQSHPDDLEVTNGGVALAMDECREIARFHVIGTGQDVQAALKLSEAPTVTGWVELTDYPHRVAQLDIGIAPLAATVFNRAKSRLKMAEMAALGVVPVVTPTADNTTLLRMGIGVPARYKFDWYDRIKRLILDEGYRKDLALTGRAIMREFTYERNAWRWLEAWEQAWNNRKAAR